MPSLPSRFLCPLAAAVLLVGLTACLSSNPPIEVRYFEPRLDDTVTPFVRSDLVLDRVTAAPHLDQRMVWRVSAVEIAYDERNRWISSPAELVEAALRSSIHTPENGSSRLRVEVVAFEGLQASSEAVIELRCSATSDRDKPPAWNTISARVPLTSDRPEDLAAALGTALAHSVRAVRNWEPEASESAPTRTDGDG